MSAQPPHDLHAEESLLGSILIDPDALGRAQEVNLQPSDFYTPAHGQIYGAMLDLARRYQGVDIVSVGDTLGKSGDAMGGKLAELIVNTPTSIHAATYAGIIKRTSQQRRLMQVGARIAAAAYAHEGPIEGLYDTVMQDVLSAVDTAGSNSHHYNSDETLMDYLAWMQLQSERNPDTIIQTGLVDLDALLCEIEPGILHVVVAKSSVGKTTYMEHVAEYNAQRGQRVAYYHYELSEKLMETRRMARWSGVPYSYLRNGRDHYDIYTEKGLLLKRYSVAQVLDGLREWLPNLVTIECAGWTAERIAADIQRLHARGECDLAVVDYLQKMPLPNMKGANTAVLLGMNAEILKTVAEQTGIPIVLGCQVRRGDHDDGTKKPSKEDIRNSGEIEEKANQIVVMHRPDPRVQGEKVEDTHGRMERMELYVEKNTTGPVGSVNVGHIVGRFRLINWQEEGRCGTSWQ